MSSVALPDDRPASAAKPANAAFFEETVLWVRHWTDRLFSFAVTRPASFRFRSGEFVMIGLPGEAGASSSKPILRAYSVASPHFAEALEFFSIKVPDGPLTSRLQKIAAGETVLLGKKPTGTLVLDALKPGKRLFMLATGTGLAPFLSVARDPAAYEAFGQLVMVHSVRESKDLAYRELFETEIFHDELVGEAARGRLIYYPTVTRDDFHRTGRITDRIADGALFRDLAMPGDRFDPEHDRAMLCGSMAMIKDVAALLESHGLKEGSNAEPGDFVIERAFVG